MVYIMDEAEALAKAAKGYKFGAEGPDYYDCSGLVFKACQKAGVYSGTRFTTFSVGHSSQFARITAPQVDDIVVWSENSAHGHMGIITAPNVFFSARSVKDGFGYNSIGGFHVYPVKPFYLRPKKTDGYKALRDLYEKVPPFTGADVKRVQQICAMPVKQQDGKFGPLTKKAVQQYQLHHDLTDDGIVGPNTRVVMGLFE